MNYTQHLVELKTDATGFAAETIRDLNNVSATINNPVGDDNSTTNTALAKNETGTANSLVETKSNTNDKSVSTDSSSANLQTLKSMQATNTDTFTAEFNDFKTANNMPDLTMEKLSQNSDLYNKFLTKVNKVENVNQKNTINEKTEHSALAQPSNNPKVVVKTDNQDVVKALAETNNLLREQNHISKNKKNNNPVHVVSNGNSSPVPAKK